MSKDTPTQSSFHDTAFRENLNQPVHSWVPWIGGYSAGFARQCIERYTSPNGVVLDPFAGVGTSLVEAARADRRSFGVELNPYAALACSVKTHAQNVDISRFEPWTLELIHSWSELKSDREYPKDFRTREPFFPAPVLLDVNRVLNWIDELPVSLESNLLRLALGSMLVSVSNYSYGPSLSTRSKSGRPVAAVQDVRSLFMERLDRMCADVERIKQEPTWAGSGIVVGNSLIADNMPTIPVDLVVTSPPYLNNYHYVRNSRPHLFFLGQVATYADIKNLQDDNFGTYWQTARSGPRPVDRTGSPLLANVLDQFASSTSSLTGVYGLEGWMSYITRYFNDSLDCLGNLKRCLQGGGTAVFVLGDSYIQGIYVPVIDIFIEVANAVGFSCVESTVVRKRSSGATMHGRRSNIDREAKPLTESAIVLQHF